MNDATNPDEPEVDDVDVIEDTHEPETPEFDEDGEPIDPDSEDEDLEDEDEPDDLDEVEIDGKKYRVPKEAALRQADYTRKTQEIAEQRKELESTLERLKGVSEAEQQALVRKATIQSQLQQLQGVNFQQLQQTNPLQAQNLQIRMLQLRQALSDADNNISQARSEAQSAAERENATRLEKGLRTVAEKIPDWSKDKAEAIRSFAIQEYGLTDEFLDNVYDPGIVIALHDAMQGRSSRKQAAAKQRIEKAQAVKPAAKVKGGKSPPKPLSDKSDVKAWMEARSKQAASSF